MARGRYRIQTVAEMTSVPAATLRAWERRYGIPSPERTESSYRLYSDRDVELIRKLRSLRESGMAPAEAARVVHRGANQEGVVAEADPFSTARDAIVAAVEDFDPRNLEAVVRRSMFLGSSTVIFEEILAPAMREIGDKWHAGEMTVAQEHLASEVLAAAAAEMLRLVRVEDRERTAVLACFADEDHAFPLYGVAFRMVQWGYRPVVLGLRTPPEAVADAVERLRPSLVGLSVTVVPSARRAKELVPGYARACGAVPWVVGGAGSEVLRSEIEAAGGLALGRQTLLELKPSIDAKVAQYQRTRSRKRG